jgi:hypothetical protein
MKLRILGNSLRLRLSRTDLARLIETGRIEATIHFAAESDARLTYALECSNAVQEMSLRWRPQEIAVLLPAHQASRWAESGQVGISSNCAAGNEVLALLVEKDFSCLHGSEADNQDAFPNPNCPQLH